MTDDIEFAKRADAFMEEILVSLENEDPDEVECDLAMGVLALEFADGSKCIMNRQTAAHQIWLAHHATAWHFEEDGAGAWVDTKGRGTLREVLAGVVSSVLGRPIAL